MKSVSLRLDQQLAKKMKLVHRAWKWLAILIILMEVFLGIFMWATYDQTGDLGEHYFSVGNHSYFVGHVYWDEGEEL